jgi:hypothetical protein
MKDIDPSASGVDISFRLLSTRSKEISSSHGRLQKSQIAVTPLSVTCHWLASVPKH